MPHLRSRHVFQLFKKRLGFNRIVSLQGPRQSGKSFFAREIAAKSLKTAKYISLDSLKLRTLARQTPESFLEAYRDCKPFIIDEAQKAPEIFDAVKLDVDENPEPGRFVLLGSTEFSREVQIKESLTGRLSRIRMFPFNLGEIQKLKSNPSTDFALLQTRIRTERNSLLKFLEVGGFPGIFHIRDDGERASRFDDWISLTCGRDILHFHTLKPNPETALELLQTLPKLDDPSLAVISKKTGLTAYEVKKHLGFLMQLFCIFSVQPHRLGTGKTRYFVCDVGLSAHLGADFRSRLVLWLYHEQFSQRSYRGDSFSNRLSYYRGSRGGVIDLVIESKNGDIIAVKILPKENIDNREFEIMKSFRTKCIASGAKSCRLIAMAPTKEMLKIDGVEIWPWEALV